MPGRPSRRPRGRRSRSFELAQDRLLLGEPAADDAARGDEQREDLRVIDAVEDARALTPRLDDPDPPQRREVLGCPARVKSQIGLQRPDRTLSILEQLQNANPRRVTKHTEEVSLDLVNLPCIVRHKRESI